MAFFWIDLNSGSKGFDLTDDFNFYNDIGPSKKTGKANLAPNLATVDLSVPITLQLFDMLRLLECC